MGSSFHDISGSKHEFTTHLGMLNMIYTYLYHLYHHLGDGLWYRFAHLTECLSGIPGPTQLIQPQSSHPCARRIRSSPVALPADFPELNGGGKSGKIHGKMWENLGKIMGKSWEMMGEIEENPTIKHREMPDVSYFGMVCGLFSRKTNKKPCFLGTRNMGGVREIKRF